MKIKLNESVKNKKGEDVQELHIDLESLTGQDIIIAEREYRLMAPNGGVMLPDMYSKQYQAMIGARAAGVSTEVIENLPMRDFSAVVMYVQNFLMYTDSDDEETFDN